MQQVMTTEKTWFKEWFDSSYYHKLYQHRNHDEAYQFINCLLSALQPATGTKMLDLGCGTGRHSIQLAHYGYDVTGLDLAATSILKAKQSSGEHLRFNRADMRDPFGIEFYNYIFSFFTSFGYFDEKENITVAQNIANAAKPGGTVLIDYLNVHTALKKIVPFEVVKRDDVNFYIARWFDANFIYKRIAISNLELANETIFTERVHLFELEDFKIMFSQVGLTFKKAYGDYKLNKYSADESDRLIMLFEK